MVQRKIDWAGLVRAKRRVVLGRGLLGRTGALRESVEVRPSPGGGCEAWDGEKGSDGVGWLTNRDRQVQGGKEGKLFVSGP